MAKVAIPALGSSQIVETVRFNAIPPDISYYIEGATFFGYFGLDVEYFLKNIHPDPVGAIDGLSARSRNMHGYRSLRHFDKLRVDASWLEQDYLSWRSQNPGWLGPALHTITGLPTLLAQQINDYALEFAVKGHLRLDSRAKRRLEHEDIGVSFDAVKRSIRRAIHDVKAVKEGELKSWLEGLRRAQEQARELRARYDHAPSAKPIDNRSIVKRSIKILTQIMGEEPTRLFIGRSQIEIEGRHCLYELQRVNGQPLAGSHGRATLSLICKATKQKIANVCIYTSDVPLLDHIASLVLHIKAGEEDEILRIGNLFNVDYDLLEGFPAIAKHCPPRPVIAPANAKKTLLKMDPHLRQQDRADRHRTVIRLAHDMRSYARTRLGLDEMFAVIDRLNLHERIAPEWHEFGLLSTS